MNKKFRALLFLFLCFSQIHANGKEDAYCPFCDSSLIQSQAFYEDDLVVALCTHKPIFPGHYLIIPKKHIERFEILSDEEALQISRVIKKVHQAASKIFGTSSYLLLQKNGKEAGQTVPHLHFHYIPKKPGQDSALYFWFKMYWAYLKKPIGTKKIEKNVEEIKRVIEIN